MARATLEKKPREVARMFDAVGKKYDLTNTVLTGGIDTLWRKATRKRLDPKPGEKVVDLPGCTR